MCQRNGLFVIGLFIFHLLTSCAHKSGQYVKWEKGDTLEAIAGRYRVPASVIEEANLETTKDRPLGPGDWVFIPQSRGIIYFKNTHYEERAYDLIKAGTFLWPVPASKEISSHFGGRWGKKHEGIDIPAPIGSSILAARDGKVVYSGRKIGGYGNLTIIAHDDGFFTVYAHAKKNFTKRGQKVSEGEVIAQVGMTGRTTGPHLHFEIRHNSESLDPREHLAQNP